MRVGHALKMALGEDGWPLFEEWSARFPNNDPEETQTKWRALDPNGEVGAARSIGLLEAAWWTGKRLDVGARTIQRLIATFEAKNLQRRWRRATAERHAAQFGSATSASPPIANGDLRAALAVVVRTSRPAGSAAQAAGSCAQATCARRYSDRCDGWRRQVVTADRRGKRGRW